MKVPSSLRVSCCAVLLGVMLQACSNLPQGQSEPEKAAGSRSSPAATTAAPARPGAGSAAPQQGAGSASGAAPPPGSSAPAAPPEPQPPALQVQLADGIRLFDQGEFYAAVGRLRNLPDVNSAPVETQTTALKYLAFSYCVTNRRTLCQQQFEAALKLDPKFELAPAERGHPIWKVVFERAKKAQPKSAPAKGAAPKAPEAKKPSATPDTSAQPAKSPDSKKASKDSKAQPSGASETKAASPAASATKSQGVPTKTQPSAGKSQKEGANKGQAEASPATPQYEAPPLKPQ